MRKVTQFTILLSLLLVSSLIITDEALAARGRVQIVNNNVVADNGLPLRGETHYVLKNMYGHNIWSYVGKSGPDPSGFEFDSFRLMGLNTIRIYANRDGTNLSLLDDIVDRAANEGFYVIIDDHHDGTPGGNCCGDYDVAKSIAFWNEVAPRYKDRTHVIYEMKNEPVAWSAQSYTSEDVQYQVDMYKLIRGYAPNTHIIMWTFANDTAGMLSKVQEAPEIDYSNASVGYHPYGSTEGINGVIELRQQYPVIQTEIGRSDNANRVITTAHEREGLSWIWLNGYNKGNEITWNPDPCATPNHLVSCDGQPPPTPTNSPTPTSSPIPPPPVPIPGRIEVEDYVNYYDTTTGNSGGVYRSDDVDIQSTSDTGGGYIVGWIDTTEWLTYNIDVSDAGLYSIAARVASQSSGGSFHIEIDGSTVATFNFPATGGWQTWVDVVANNVPLTQGSNELKIVMGSSDFNINYLDFSPESTSLIQGDINNDGVVNILDYTLLSNAFGTSDPVSDINTDGTVNILDYTILSNNFGATSP